jgi:hypothetical protein
MIIILLVSYLLGFNKCEKPPAILCKSLATTDYQSAYLECSSGCGEKGHSEVKRIVMYETQQHQDPILVASCIKWKITRILTETWTFSKISSIHSFKRVSIIPDECRLAWKSKCDNQPCKVALDVEVTGDYYWASETTEEFEGISIDTYEIPTYYSSSGRHFIYKGREQSIRELSIIEEDKITLWLEQPLHQSSRICPWIKGVPTVCQKERQKLWCPKEEIYLEESKLLSGGQQCQGRQLMISKSGHIWEYSQQSELPILVRAPGIDSLLFPSDN